MQNINTKKIIILKNFFKWS